MEYQLDKWKRQDWHKGRGQWFVLRRWGRVSAKQGQSLEKLCDRYEEGVEIFEAVEKRRAKRGYSTW